MDDNECLNPSERFKRIQEQFKKNQTDLIKKFNPSSDLKKAGSTETVNLTTATNKSTNNSSKQIISPETSIKPAKPAPIPRPNKDTSNQIRNSDINLNSNKMKQNTTKSWSDLIPKSSDYYDLPDIIIQNSFEYKKIQLNDIKLDPTQTPPKSQITQAEIDKFLSWKLQQ